VTEETYLDPSESTAIALVRRNLSGPIVMLNLLRFRDAADYSASPELAPPESISGRQAFDHYIDHTLPFLLDSGGDVLYLGTGGDYFIGPSDEGWDFAMLIRQTSLESFFAFASNEAYQAGIGHRTAAVRDSRILPLVDAAAPPSAPASSASSL
jgi:hypothetical protein